MSFNSDFSMTDIPHVNWAEADVPLDDTSIVRLEPTIPIHKCRQAIPAQGFYGLLMDMDWSIDYIFRLEQLSLI